MMLLKSRSTSGEQVTDGIKQSNVAAHTENLLNLNLISCINLSIEGIAIFLLYS